MNKHDARNGPLTQNHPILTLKHISLAVLSSALLSISFSFIQVNLGILAWFGLVPLFLAVENKTIRQRCLLSFIFGFLFFLGTIYWIAHVSVFGLIVLCLYLSLYIVLFGIMARTILAPFCLLYIPLAWVMLEILRSHAFTGFGWGLIGHTQFKNILLIQVADKVGVWGVGFLLVITNVALAQVMSKWQKVRWRNPCIIIPCILILLSYGYGFICLDKSFSGPSIRVAVIQGNIPQEQKWNPQYVQGILNRFRQLSIKARAEKPDLIIWPETSVPGYLLDEPRLLKTITDLSQDMGAYLLVGSPREDLVSGAYYNSAFLFSARGELKHFHDKIHLVPFGEYIPYKNFFWFVNNTRIADFSSGNRHTIFFAPGYNGSLVRFGVLVCFEDIFGDLVRAFRVGGADFLVTITNEAWFKMSSEPLQHLAISTFRAIENRCWFIRCANTGISCFIDPYGRVKNKIEKAGADIFVEGFKVMDLSCDSGAAYR